MTLVTGRQRKKTRNLSNSSMKTIKSGLRGATSRFFHTHTFSFPNYSSIFHFLPICFDSSPNFRIYESLWCDGRHKSFIRVFSVSNLYQLCRVCLICSEKTNMTRQRLGLVWYDKKSLKLIR